MSREHIQKNEQVKNGAYSHLFNIIRTAWKLGTFRALFKSILNCRAGMEHTSVIWFRYWYGWRYFFGWACVYIVGNGWRQRPSFIFYYITNTGFARWYVCSRRCSDKCWLRRLRCWRRKSCNDIYSGSQVTMFTIGHVRHNFSDTSEQYSDIHRDTRTVNMYPRVAQGISDMLRFT